jgi:hypothetical protein
MKTITVTDALFARLLAMRDAYGDTDIAGMLDRITEVPASRLGPAYGTQCQRRQAGPITVLGDDAIARAAVRAAEAAQEAQAEAGAEQRAYLAGHAAGTAYRDSSPQVSDVKGPIAVLGRRTGNPLTDLGAESHAYGQAMRAAGITDTYLRDPKERAFLAGWRAGMAGFGAQRQQS